MDVARQVPGVEPNTSTNRDFPDVAGTVAKPPADLLVEPSKCLLLPILNKSRFSMT